MPSSLHWLNLPLLHLSDMDEKSCSCFSLTGRLDIDVEYVNDCKRLAKQCRLQDLIDDLETKCKKVYEFGKHFTCCCLCCVCVCVCVPFEGKRGRWDASWCPLGFQKLILFQEFPCLLSSFQSCALCRVAWWFLAYARCLSSVLNIFTIVEQPWQQDFALVASRSLAHCRVYWEVLFSRDPI